MLTSLIEIQQQLLTGIASLNLVERTKGPLVAGAETVLAGLKAMQVKEAGSNKPKTTKPKPVAKAPVKKK